MARWQGAWQLQCASCNSSSGELERAARMQWSYHDVDIIAGSEIYSSAHDKSRLHIFLCIQASLLRISP